MIADFEAQCVLGEDRLWRFNRTRSGRFSSAATIHFRWQSIPNTCAREAGNKNPTP
jgi:hypothetical protein